MYLAQDTKLDRKVALKILPADVPSGHNRMDRFVREAKSAAGSIIRTSRTFTRSASTKGRTSS